MFNRRTFLKASPLIAMAPGIPTFLARAARAAQAASGERVLVVIQLDGGNDGINTVVSHADEGYARHRHKLRLSKDRLLKLDNQVALHPSMRAMAELFESGRLAIVHGVGYPMPSRSHQLSSAIWHTARFDREEHKSYGWIGRAMDETAAATTGTPSSVLVGDDSPPISLRGRRSTVMALARLDELDLKTEGSISPTPAAAASDSEAAFVQQSMLDAYAAAKQLRDVANKTSASGSYPSTKLAQRLKMVAQLIKADVAARVYYAIHPGYDTHVFQLPRHAELLAELSGAVKAFLDDLAADGVAHNVALLCFSEFGRRVDENASLGTDHGTAGPVLVAGPGVNAGLHGKTPSLIELEEGDLKMSIDFRQIYATLLQDWLGVPAMTVLNGSFQTLPLFAS